MTKKMEILPAEGCNEDEKIDVEKAEEETDTQTGEDDAGDADESSSDEVIENSPAPAEEPVKATSATSELADTNECTKDDIDRVVSERGLDKALEILGKCRVVKLRNLARGYANFPIAGREVSKANKSTLLEAFREFYSIEN